MKPFYFAPILFLCSTHLYSQDVIIETYKDSKISGILKQQSIQVTTKYGKLDIPVTDITKITVGNHPPSEIKLKIEDSLLKLSSLIHKDREVSTDYLLQQYRYSYYNILNFRSKDKETKIRLDFILNKIRDEKNQKLIPYNEDDTIEVGEFYFSGRLGQEEISVENDELGAFKIGLNNIRKIQFLVSGSVLKVEASKTYADDQWVICSKNVKGQFRVTAKGYVELWPNAPGDYITTPNGAFIKVNNTGQNVAGKGGYIAGQLIGKLGENGQVFIIGDHYLGESSTREKLYLRIVPSTWSALPSGYYEVTIK